MSVSVIHANQVSQLSSNVKTLKNGSSVLVRVISDKGAGRYQGSVAGVRVNLTSQRPLQIGQTFVATVTSKDGTIFVTPKPGELAAGSKDFQISVFQNSQINSFLQAIGLPPDQISMHLFQVLKQMELKLNPALLFKLHNLSLRFKGKELSASEILLLLAQKQISASEEEILDLLLQLSGNWEKNPEQQGNQQNQFSLLNKINSVSGKWSFIPFELVESADLENITDKKTHEVLGTGCIKLLLDNSSVLKLLNLECNYNQQKFLFSLHFYAGKCDLIKFNISGEEENHNQLCMALEKRLFMAGFEMPLEWCDSSEVEGFACTDEEIVMFGGEV